MSDEEESTAYLPFPESEEESDKAVDDQFEKDEPKLISEAQDLMKSEKYLQASEILSLICEYRAKKYGDMAYECADVYLLYGESLLRHSQSKEEIFSKLNKAVDKKLKGKTVDSDPEEDDEEEIIDSSFQAAEKIYQQALNSKKYPLDEKSIRSKLFRLYADWAELFQESDNFEQAIKEFEKAYHFAADDKQRAEVHLQLAICLINTGEQLKGVHEYENALKYLEKKESIIKFDLDDIVSLITEVRDRVNEFKEDLVLAEKQKALEEEQNKKLKDAMENIGEATVLIPRKKEEKRKLENGDEESNKKVKKE